MKSTLTKLVIAGGLSLAVAAPLALASHHGRHAERFEQTDVNGDGAISLDEVRARDLERFAEIDVNTDGFLTQDEMIAFKEAQRRARLERRVARRFENLDSDGDGLISAAEHAAREHPMFERADANEDGLLTMEEIRAAAPKRHGRHGPQD